MSGLTTEELKAAGIKLVAFSFTGLEMNSIVGTFREVTLILESMYVFKLNART